MSTSIQSSETFQADACQSRRCRRESDSCRAALLHTSTSPKPDINGLQTRHPTQGIVQTEEARVIESWESASARLPCPNGVEWLSPISIAEFSCVILRTWVPVSPFRCAFFLKMAYSDSGVSVRYVADPLPCQIDLGSTVTEACFSHCSLSCGPDLRARRVGLPGGSC